MELNEIPPKAIATMGRLKLRENVTLCPTLVPPSTHGNKGIGEVQRDNTNCAPLYIVGGLSAFQLGAIPFKAVENVILTAGFANSLGFLLEYHLTVRWPDGVENSRAFLRGKIEEWQRYNVGLGVYVWARETTSGPHSHFLLHIPRHLADSFRKLARRWVKGVHGVQRLPKGTFSMTRVRSLGDPYEHIRNRVRYILKGTDDATRLFLGYGGKKERGFITGKRVGTSQALGEEARRKAGGVRLSGHRKPTQEMLLAATVRDQRREAFRESFRQIDHKDTQAAC